MQQQRKVLWGEGTLISPQHFQQQEFYYDELIAEYYSAVTPYNWGYLDLQLNLSGSKTGVISVDRIKGFFKDGSFFNETNLTAPNLKIQIPANLENEYIYLVWSNFSAYQNNYTFANEQLNQDSRYLMKDVDLMDMSEIKLPKRNVVIVSPNLRLVMLKDLPDNANYLPIAHILSSNSTGEVFINESFVPPTLAMSVTKQLDNYQIEVFGMLRQRMQALARVLTNPSLMTTGDVRDFLMLQTINRYYAYMHHLSTTLANHPCHVFEQWLKLYGDLSTFKKEKISLDLPVYNHDHLNECFENLMQHLREVLSIVLEQKAILIPLELRDEATRVAITPDITLLNSCNFILAINASLPDEVLRQRLPATIKISSVEKIKDLVAYHLPGIKVHALATAPRELPYHAGFSYFEIDKSSELWQDLESSSGIAIHLAGDFPDLQMECWAIKPV